VTAPVPPPGGGPERRLHTLVGRDGLPYRSLSPGTVGGHRRTRVYGRLDCPSALRAIAGGHYVTHRVFFADEATAVEAATAPAPCVCRRSTPVGKPRAGPPDHEPGDRPSEFGEREGMSADGMLLEADSIAAQVEPTEMTWPGTDVDESRRRHKVTGAAVGRGPGPNGVWSGLSATPCGTS